MSEHLKNAPVFYSVAEIRFNPTLAMDDSVKDIQKKLGKDFPGFVRGTVLQFQMKPGESPEAQPIQAIPMPRWQFLNRNETAGIIVGQNTVIFHTTEYSNSEDFLGSVLRGLSIVDECVDLAFVERVGVRLLDAIPFNDIDELKQLVKPGIAGTSGILDGKLRQSISQTDLTFDRNTTLSSKVAILDGRIGVPQDLHPIALKFKDWVERIDGYHMVLDNDCFIEERLDIDLTTVEKKLQAAKSHVSSAFNKSVTKEAIDRWR